MSTQKHLEIKRSEVGLVHPPSWSIPLLLLGTFVIMGTGIAAVVLALSGRYVPAAVNGFIAIVVAIIGRACDYLDWHRNVKYEFDNDGFTYSYDLDKNVLPTGNPRVKYKVSSVRSVKCKGKFIIVKGDMVKHTPLVKPKPATVVKMADIADRHDEIMNLINKYVC